LVRITVKYRVRGRIRVRDKDRGRVRFRDRDRRSEAISFGANSDRGSEPNTVLTIYVDLVDTGCVLFQI